MRKTFVIIFVIVLLVCLSLVAAYFLTTLNNNKSSAKTPNNFAAVNYYPLNGYYEFTFTLSDEFIDKPVQIKDISGKLIATALLSVKANYTNGEGKQDSVLTPLIIQKQNGESIVFSNTKTGQISDNEIPSFVQFLKSNSNWNKGNHKYVDIALDLNSANNDKTDTIYSQNLILDVIASYQKGREKDMQNFLTTGDSKIGLIIPLYVDTTGK